jgi:hypothetical protein
LRDGPTERSRARGTPRQCQARSLRLDRSKRRLSPNPISSGTFCRKLVVMHGWSAIHPVHPTSECISRAHLQRTTQA